MRTQARWINDGQCMTTAHLLAAISMSTVVIFSARMISRCRGEAFQCLKSRCFLLSVTSSESLKLLCASPDAACGLATGARVLGNFPNHHMR